MKEIWKCKNKNGGKIKERKEKWRRGKRGMYKLRNKKRQRFKNKLVN